MSAPSSLSRGPLSRPCSLVVALLVLVLAATLLSLAGTPSPARADDEPGAPSKPGPASEPPPPLSFRGDIAGVDAPKMPKGCFGPARSGPDPFPCPLNTYRKKNPTIVLWGDSHAYMYIPALKRAAQGERVNVVSFVAGSCPPALITNNNGPGMCRRSNYVALKTVEKLKRKNARFKVVIGSNWSGFRRAYRRLFLENATGTPSGYNAFTKDMIRLAHHRTPMLFDRLGRMGVDVDLIGPAATVPPRRAACSVSESPFACDLPRWRAMPKEGVTRRYVRELQSRLRGRTRIIDPVPGYCTATVCRGKIGSIETYFDDLHLSATRTRNLARFFKASVRDLHR